MSSWLLRWRTMTVGVSCLVHAALIAGVLLAEQWTMDAHASRPPVLPAEMVTLDDEKPAAPAPPPPPPRQVEPPKKVEAPKPPPKPTTLPKLIEAPMPKIAEAPADPEPRRAPEPAPAPVAPAPPAATPSTMAPAPAAPAIAANPDPAPAAEPGPRSGRPAGLPGPAIASASPDGIPLGRAGSGGTGQALASASGRDSGATGAITRAARPSGGYQVKPTYPASARRLGVQGTAMLRVHVLVDGRVGEVLVEQTAGHPDLDLAAADAVRRWRFDPARRGDEAVAMWVLLPVEFRLK